MVARVLNCWSCKLSLIIWDTDALLTLWYKHSVHHQFDSLLTHTFKVHEQQSLISFHALTNICPAMLSGSQRWTLGRQNERNVRLDHFEVHFVNWLIKSCAPGVSDYLVVLVNPSIILFKVLSGILVSMYVYSIV